MDDRTIGRLRDGSLALVVLGVLLGHLRRRNGLGTVLDLRSALVGVAGAAGLEAVLFRHPARTRELWARPTVRVASVLGTVLGGRALVRQRSRAAAALCWGLLAYLAMLGFVLADRPNPVSRVVGAGRVGVEEGRVAGQS